MGYRQSENKNDFYNVLHHLNILSKTLQFDPIFEPTLEETKALDDIHERILWLISATEYNK
tara:strand:+ start:500 stop:682 length:183 start_codon:yes stop_codon:yes gene_type:complete